VAKLVTKEEYQAMSKDKRLHYIVDLLNQHAEKANFTTIRLHINFPTRLTGNACSGWYEFNRIFIDISQDIDDPPIPLSRLAHELGHWQNFLIDFKGNMTKFLEARPIDTEPHAWLHGAQYARSWNIWIAYLNALRIIIDSLERRGPMPLWWRPYREELLTALRNIYHRLKA